MDPAWYKIVIPGQPELMLMQLENLMDQYLLHWLQ